MNGFVPHDLDVPSGLETGPEHNEIDSVVLTSSMERIAATPGRVDSRQA